MPDRKRPLPFNAPRYIGVRCECGAYMVFREVERPDDVLYCDLLSQPAWIICVNCEQERRYTQADMRVFTWPPSD